MKLKYKVIKPCLIDKGYKAGDTTNQLSTLSAEYFLRKGKIEKIQKTEQKKGSKK